MSQLGGVNHSALTRHEVALADAEPASERRFSAPLVGLTTRKVTLGLPWCGGAAVRTWPYNTGRLSRTARAVSARVACRQRSMVWAQLNRGKESWLSDHWRQYFSTSWSLLSRRTHELTRYE